MALEATHLRGNRWAVSPIGQLGTCGWYPVAWEVEYVTARSAKEAIQKVNRYAIERSAEEAIQKANRRQCTYGGVR